jgi:hypothetical protein
MKNYIYALLVLVVIGCEGDSNLSPEAGGVSMGGSTAKFTIAGEYLYTLDQNSITTFHIRSESEIVLVGQLSVWRNDLETIFPYGGYLFVGSTTGVLIFSIRDPANPAEVSEFRHFVSCDPVVVQGNYAYSTLRGGNQCGNSLNQLDIIDISEITNPTLVKSYQLSGPKGLAINGNCLYVCDNGVKVLDVSDHNNIRMINHINNIPANDVIFFNNQLLVTADDGFYQFNVANCGDITELGHFSY